jgi:TetR/AcrR family transcriptional regulator
LQACLRKPHQKKLQQALLAKKSNITEAALYRHFPSKRSIYAELFSYCDDAIFSKCAELKKADLDSKEKG